LHPAFFFAAWHTVTANKTLRYASRATLPLIVTGRDPAALDAVAMAVHRFETFTGSALSTVIRPENSRCISHPCPARTAVQRPPHSSLHRTRLFARATPVFAADQVDGHQAPVIDAPPTTVISTIEQAEAKSTFADLLSFVSCESFPSELVARW
jgi:hypothetical protein